VAVGESAGRLYLNFTPDWRSDFTVSIAHKDVSAFGAAGINLTALPASAYERGGFLAWRNGPMIEADGASAGKSRGGGEAPVTAKGTGYHSIAG
jgi:hypothetical protein